METVKGFKDYTGEEAQKRAQIKQILEETFKLYNFQSSETPIIEYEEFVKGDNQNDEAVSEIFKLQDRGKRKLALRYELTFPLKRIMQNKKLPYKRYQIGTVFRDEPTSTNRYREFIQLDADIINSTIKDEAEILAMAKDIFNKLNIDIEINFNNRKLLNEILEELKIKEKDKQNIIREIDKLDKLPENEVKKNLKKYKAEKILQILKKPRSYFKKYPAYKEIQELEDICKIYKVKINFQPFLARGLSYYNGTIFEIKTKKIKETITAGGSFMFNNIQSTGISFGLERLSSLAKINIENNKILIISLNQNKKAIQLADKLRKLNIPTQIYYNKPGKALDYANTYQIPKVIFIGKEEVKSKKLKIKDMNSGKEQMISEAQLEKDLEKQIK